MKEWRRIILENGSFEEVALLTNRGEWVFDDVAVQYTIGLVTVHKGAASPHLTLHGPYGSLADYHQGMNNTPLALDAEEFMSWGENLVFPTLRSPADLVILRSLLKHPKIGDDRTDWQFRPLRELDASNDRHLFHFGEPEENMWPVYSGSSFNLWTPETGEVYAWVDPKRITQHLFEKRERQSRTRSSAFHGLDPATVADKSTLPLNCPRIVFRDVARATDPRKIGRAH